MQPTGNAPHDERLDPGMATQMELLRTARAEGAEQAGWKAGLGTTTWQATLGTDAALVGFLLDRTRIADGAVVPVGTWSDARAEAEIAFRFDREVAGDASPEEVMAAVDAIGPAIELVDIHPAPEDPASALAGNLYHRAWLIGDLVPMDADVLDGYVGRVTAMGEALDPVDDVQSATGAADGVLTEIARIAARHGRGVRAGDLVLLGAIRPPSAIGPGGSYHFELSGHRPIEVSFSD